MLEEYILTGDGKEYIDVNNVREALGIIDEHVDILGVIKKLKEERDGKKAELELTNRLYKENSDFVDKVCEAVDIQRPYLESGYDKAVKLIAGFKRERDELKEDKDLLEELHANHISQLNDYAELAFELGIESGDAESIKDYIISLKKERDQLKEKCDKLKKRTNAVYGASCGYSASKEPAFRCDVISYGCEFGSMPGDTFISVELRLTPTANYKKGTFDPKDLRWYIEDYGREKKLGIIESVDYQNAKAARAKLAYLYKQVLGKEKLDMDLSPHEVMKAILDAVKKLRDAQFASDQCLRSVYMHVYEGTRYDIDDIYAAPDKIADGIVTRYNSARMSSRLETLSEIDDLIDELCDKYNVVQPVRSLTTRERLDYIFKVLADYREMHDSEWKRVEDLKKEKRAVEDSLAELRAKIREIYKEVFGYGWEESQSYVLSLNDINKEYKRVAHNFEERTADWGKARQELDRYRLAVGSLLGIPKETRDDINAIERSFTFSKKMYESLKEFRDDVCEILDIPSSMADGLVLKEIHDVADRYDELEDFRADICGILDLEGMLGTPKQNDKYILEQVEKMKDNKPTVFRNDVAVAIGMTPKDSDSDIIKRVMHIGEYCDKLARLRSNICTALCLGHEDCDGNIIGRIHMMQDCHDKLCKDYTELRKAIWEAMNRKPETLPEETARLVGEVAALARGEKLLISFRDGVAEAIGMDYPTTNQVILNSVQYICKDRKDAYEIVAKLNDQVTELEKAKEDLGQDLCELRKNAIDDLKSRGFLFRFEEDETLPEIYDKLLKRYDWAYGSYKEQYRLRQQWHVKYESEHERANGVQKALDREREKCRVKDISLETAKKQYQKVCSNLETAECALNGMKSKVRELREEKSKVISALGQDIWDDCLK